MNAVEFHNVTKIYNTSKGKYSLLRDVLGENMLRFIKKKSDNKNQIAALKNVSFNVKKGEVVGIIGRNGAGKSTILKLISRITYPHKGKVEARGRIGSFIELGAGLHHELTGRENIFLYGSILGMKKRELEENFDDIVEFAEIRKFLDIPIKKYSSGMYSRLGFSVCAHCNPDILLVDEVLAVGDINFQERCLEKMHSFAHEKTVIFVSHNMEAIKSICDRVIYLENGRIKKTGKANTVIDYYLQEASREYDFTT